MVKDKIGTVYLPFKTGERLRVLCARMRKPMSSAIDEALQPWLDNAEEKLRSEIAATKQP